MYCYNCMNKMSGDSNFCRRCGRNSIADRSAHHLAPGTLLNNRYMVGNALGEDGYSVTYIARDLNLDICVLVWEYYPMGRVTRDSAVSGAVIVGDDPNTRGLVSRGTDEFIAEARRSQQKGRDVRDIFAENNTAYVVTAAPAHETPFEQKESEQRGADAEAKAAQDDYRDGFNGAEVPVENGAFDDSSSHSGKMSATSQKPEQTKRQTQPNNKKKKKGAKALIAVSVVVVLVLIGAVVFFMINGRKSDGKTDASTAVTTAAATKPQKDEQSSDNTVKMMDTHGMKLSDAQTQLEERGLRVEVSREHSSEVAKDYIIRQSVDEGQTLHKGDSVMLYVSDGAEKESVTEEPHSAPYFSSITASSVRGDESVSFAPENVTVNDGSCWSAVSADNGEWIRFGAEDNQWVKGVSIVNGNARDNESFQQNARVTAIRFEFSDGTSIEKSVNDSMSLQNIDFGREVKTSGMKMTVIGHRDGSVYPYICISYIKPY